MHYLNRKELIQQLTNEKNAIVVCSEIHLRDEIKYGFGLYTPSRQVCVVS